MNNVLIMPGFGQRDVGAILETAKNAALDDVIVLGWGADGDLFLSSSSDNSLELLWMLAQAQKRVLD